MEFSLGFRVLFFLLSVSAGVISGVYRRRARQATGTIARSQEGSAALLGRALMGFGLLAVILLHGLAPHWMAWASLSVPVWVRWLGVLLGFSLLPFLVWVLRSIGANISETVLTKSEHQLVTAGPYRWIRHPLYLGGMTLILSLGLIAGSWLTGTLWLAATAIFRLVVIPAEERNLLAKFGPEYEAYRQRTGALLPRLG
jgi:protein-S-isoprenylcysteine O-methyltransferase Ste14